MKGWIIHGIPTQGWVGPALSALYWAVVIAAVALLIRLLIRAPRREPPARAMSVSPTQGSGGPR